MSPDLLLNSQSRFFFFFFFISIPPPSITHIWHMCIWGKSQLTHLYQQYHFITAAARILLTQAQLLPIAPVPLLEESHREPRSSNWKDEQQGRGVWTDRMAARSSVRAGCSTGPTSPLPGHRARTPALPDGSAKGRIPLRTCKAEQPWRHLRLALQCAGDLSASLTSLRRAGDSG